MTTADGIGVLTERFQRPHAVPRGHSSLTLLIAWRNLVHDRVRFAVTLVGIAFSTVLMGIQLGMLLNFMHTTSIIVDQAGADVWIAAQGARSVDLATPIEERRRFQALSIEGVAKAEPMLLVFRPWKRNDGVREMVIIVGVDPDSEMGLPPIVEPAKNIRDVLSIPNGVVVDRLYAQKLGVHSIGQLVEINDHRARIAGFTDGIRTFTQSPYVFTSLKNARLLTGQSDKDITYVLIRLDQSRSQMPVVEALSKRMPDVDVLQTKTFSDRSRGYWLFTTGAGITLISSSLLALLVGVVIVAQTLYASTMDRLPEYAVIRAMGGPRSYLYRIVIKQAVIGGVIGGTIGLGIVVAFAYFARNSSSPPQVPLWLAGSIGIITIAMCVCASLVSLSKVTTIDPVKVFR
jgi:putative ABC transport system permease protein